MRIGVLGAGTAGIVALSLLLVRRLELSNIRTKLAITCIHDPLIPTVEVGESISPTNFNVFKEAFDLDFNVKLPIFDGTLRYYTRQHFDNEEDNFSIHYPMPGAHLNSQTLSKQALKIFNKKYDEFHEVHDKVISVKQKEFVVVIECEKETYEFDYIIDCRGSPTKEELNSDVYETEKLLETVNSVILYPEAKKYYEPYTSSYFHKNGWMFGVPLLHRKAWGYLYNNKITSEQEAIEHFSELKNIDASKLRRFSWQPYYRKQAMDGRILYLGNKLYLYEPANAFPLFYYHTLVNHFITHIPTSPIDHLNFIINTFHREKAHFINDVSAITYAGDVHKIDSPFWNYIKPKTKNWLKESYTWNLWVKQVKKTNKIDCFFFQGSSLMEEYINGFKINLDEY